VLGEVSARVLLPAPLPWLYPQPRYRPDVQLGFVLAPNQHAFSADKPVTINAQGLRGSEISETRDASRTRLLFLGDSIVFGYGVADEDVVTARVHDRLERAGIASEVVNTAVPAYNTQQEIGYLEREGLRYAPDWVVLGVCWNDISDKSDVVVSADGWLISSSSTGPPVAAGLIESPTGYSIRNLLKRSRLLYGILEGGRAIRGSFVVDDESLLRSEVLEGTPTARVEAGWQRVAFAVHRFRELADAHAFHPLIVAFPIPLALERTFPRSSYPARLRTIADGEGLPFLDLTPVFASQFHGHESLFIPYDGDHPNRVGHDVAAMEITRFIEGARARQ